MLERELAEERQAKIDMALRQLVELLAAPALLLEGDDFTETLHRVDRKSAEFSCGFARL